MCMDPRPLDMSSFPRPGPLDSSLSFSLQLPHRASCLAPTLGTQVTLTGMVAESSCFVANVNLPSTIRVNSLNPSSFSNPGLVAHGTGLGTAISWKHKAHSGHLEASPPQSTQKYPTAPTGESQRYVASREEPRGPSVERTRQAHTLTHHKNPKTFQKERALTLPRLVSDFCCSHRPVWETDTSPHRFLNCTRQPVTGAIIHHQENKHRFTLAQQRERLCLHNDGDLHMTKICLSES